MSINVADNPVNTSTFGTVLAETSDDKPPRSGEGRVRLPNKTQWALRSILDAAQEGRAQMQEILDWIKVERLDAKGRYDTARLVRLGELDGIVAQLALNVAELERLAGDARIGIYEPRIAPTKRIHIDAKQ